MIEWVLSRAPREQRDARDAVFTHGVVGALGHEAVLRVLAPLDDLEAGALDRFAVAVSLHRPADARRPERRVAGDALWQLLGRDDVGQCQPSAGPQRISRRRR